MGKSNFTVQAMKLSYEVDHDTFAKLIKLETTDQSIDFDDDMVRLGAYNVDWGGHSGAQIMFTVDWDGTPNETALMLKAIEDRIQQYITDVVQ